MDPRKRWLSLKRLCVSSPTSSIMRWKELRDEKHCKTVEVATKTATKPDARSVPCGGTSAGPAPSFAQIGFLGPASDHIFPYALPNGPYVEIMLLESSTASPVAEFEAEEALGAFVDPLIAPKLSSSESVDVTLSSSSSTHFQNPEWVLSVQRLSLRLAAKISVGDEMWHEFLFIACALPFAFAAAHQLSLANQCQKGGVVLLVSYFGRVESLVLEPWATHVWFNQLSSPVIKSDSGTREFLRDYSRCQPIKPEHMRTMWEARMKQVAKGFQLDLSIVYRSIP
eukprot:g7311.t1